VAGNSPPGWAQVNSLIKGIDQGLYNFWITLDRGRQVLLLRTLSEGRQTYCHTELRRTIPWQKRGGWLARPSCH
jgi:hypothetical protein